MYRIIAVMLALLLLASCVVSCSQPSSGDEENTTHTDSATETETAAETYPLPDGLDFGGRTYTIYVERYADVMKGPDKYTGGIVDDFFSPS